MKVYHEGVYGDDEAFGTKGQQRAGAATFHCPPLIEGSEKAAAKNQ